MAKWLGLLVGALLGNALNTAALILLSLSGYLFGVWLERRSDPILRHRKYLSKDHEAFQHLLHQSTFLMMGYLAKADGRVSEQEIATAEEIFDSFHFDSGGRQEAIRLFNAGKHPEFNLDSILNPLASVSRRHRSLIKVFLEIQARIVIADGGMDTARRRPFIMIARQLGFSEQLAGNILRRIQARTSQAKPSDASGLDLESAYALLEVPPNCSKQELKQAYRRAMSEHHPDKLMSQGATEQMIETATEQTQLIQKAYEAITAVRK
ncbi:co-chaperone DjlA [Litoribrevibacter euphylliae]|uniref:Co-chaperone DjlA n=1 Tax=Litoribrevibacter euphylliae TaxID=1834034 RepID=A0ABV7HAD9_9GAMM